MTTLEDDISHLLNILSSPSLTKEQTIEFLDKHSPCFEEDLCHICEALDGDVDVLRVLASNTALNTSIQMRVLNEALKWQDREIGVMLDFVGNPSISNDIKDYVLGEEAELHNYPDWGIIEKIHEIAKNNPSISKVEIDKFLSIYAE